MFATNSPLRKMFDLNIFHKKRIYAFSEGSIEDFELLGSKGANLCEMSRLGIPAPDGFIITTESCVEYFDQKDNKAATDQLMHEYLKGIKDLEKLTGNTFGRIEEGADRMPLLLSVRSGAAVVMPGLTDTVLHVGINEELVQVMVRISNNPRWAYDTYRRFLQQFGTVVLHVDRRRYEEVMRRARARCQPPRNSMLTAEDLQQVIEQFKAIAEVPANPREQLERIITSMFCSWYSPRAVKYRAVNSLKSEFGCAVVVQRMVYGNVNARSGSGIVFTRNPVTGSSFVTGEFLCNADGDEVLSGERATTPVTEMRAKLPEVYNALVRHYTKLERHYRDMQAVEFTVQDGELFVLESKRGKRTAGAAVQIAVSMVVEGVIHEREALLRINPKQMDYFQRPVVDPEFAGPNHENVQHLIVCRGLAVSTGAAVGRLVFADSEVAAAGSSRGPATVLCLEEFAPEDMGRLKAAAGTIVLRSGQNSYVAEVLRSKGKPAVAGLRDLRVDAQQRALCAADGTVLLREGDEVTVDGSAGLVLLGAAQTCEAGSGEFFSMVTTWADRYKRLRVQATADSVEDVLRAKTLGAEGVGMLRTEFMFRQEGSADIFRQAILARTPDARCTFLAKMITAHQEQFLEVFRVMNHRPVTVRLLDLGLHELFPSPESPIFDREVRAMAERLGFDADRARDTVLQLQDSDESLGRRGRRLAALYPEVAIMQTKAIVGAALQARAEGVEVFPSVLLPKVAGALEAGHIAPMVHQAWARACEEAGHSVNFLLWSIGALLEEPRACLVADRILGAQAVEFAAVNSEDLTELVFALSRPDTETLMALYAEKHLVAKSPLNSLDVQAVGSLVHLAVNKAKHADPKTQVTLVGEHAGDPFSVRFCNRIGVDAVSCAPSRIAVAKVAAAQAEIEQASAYRGERAQRSEGIYRRLLTGEIIL